MNLEFYLLFPHVDKQCESKTLLGWRALERRLERYETEIKFRLKMCFNLFWLTEICKLFNTFSKGAAMDGKGHWIN